MDPMNKEGIELEITIEELESKIAPDGGETVLPLPIPHGKKHQSASLSGEAVARPPHHSFLRACAILTP